MSSSKIFTLINYLKSITNPLSCTLHISLEPSLSALPQPHFVGLHLYNNFLPINESYFLQTIYCTNTKETRQHDFQHQVSTEPSEFRKGHHIFPAVVRKHGKRPLLSRTLTAKSKTPSHSSQATNKAIFAFQARPAMCSTCLGYSKKHVQKGILLPIYIMSYI